MPGRGYNYRSCGTVPTLSRGYGRTYVPLQHIKSIEMRLRNTSLALLSCWAVVADALEYVQVPRSPAEPRWAADEIHVKPRAENSSAWPYGPFSTKGRDIVNTRGEVITWAGVNWPLSLETMVPEGLEWASVEEILDNVASVGFNFIRMQVLPHSFASMPEANLAPGVMRLRWWTRCMSVTARMSHWRSP